MVRSVQGVRSAYSAVPYRNGNEETGRFRISFQIGMARLKGGANALEKRILLAVPTFENVKTETYRSLWAAKDEAVEAGISLDLALITGYDCAKARNDAAKKALEGGYSQLLFVDSDTILPAGALGKLTEFENVGICLGAYPRGSDPTKTTVYSFGFGYEDDNNIRMDELAGLTRVAVKGGGFGCALVDCRIFEKADWPWFMYEPVRNGEYLSEDLYFCRKARQYGFGVELDARVRCRHVKSVILE